jgi:hypothetical protein
VFSYPYGFIAYPVNPAIGLSDILYLINAYTSDVQHKDCNNNNNGDNNGENNQNVNPTPPPLPTLEQVLVMQAQMLQTMQQTTVNMLASQHQVPPPPPAH